MKYSTATFAAALFAVSVVTGASAHEPEAKAAMAPMPGMSTHEMKDMKAMHGQMSAGSMELHKSMMSGMSMKMKMSGDVDKDFAMMMAMHHQQAVRMADIEIAKGSNAQLKEMARKMKAAQLGEIQQLMQYGK